VTERYDQPRRAYTLEQAWEFIRARILQQQASGKKRTLPFEVSVDDRGIITNVTHLPAKEIIQ
jgi:hypothetical protein